MGRPSKYSTDRASRVLDALRSGNTRRASAAYGGVDERTVERWAARNVGFADAIKKAEADAEIRAVAQVTLAAQDGTWQAAAWWLERRRPDDYGRRERLDVNIRQHAEKLASELGLDPDELIAEAQRIVRGH